jgi:hypothetical protein
MTWPLVRAGMLAVAATLAMVATVQLAPARGPLAVAAWLLLLGALAVRLLLRWLQLAFPRPRPSPFDAALTARPAPPKPPAELDRLARLLTLSSASALHAHLRLRPELRPVAADRLAWWGGIDLDADPAAARAALGEAAWALVRPDPGEPPDRDAPGAPPAALAEAVAALERLAEPGPTAARPAPEAAPRGAGGPPRRPGPEEPPRSEGLAR